MPITCGSLTFPATRRIYPATTEAAQGLRLSGPGDGGTFINFKGRMYGYMGDAQYYTGIAHAGLNSHGCWVPIGDPTVSFPTITFLQADINELETHIDYLFNGAFLTNPYFRSHLQNAGGVDVGGVLIKFNNFVDQSATGKIHRSTVYRSEDGQAFTNRNETAAKSEGTWAEPNLTNAFLHDTTTDAVRFLAPRVCQTFFDGHGRPIRTSSYFTKPVDLSGKPLYQNYSPVPDSEPLYCYIYGQDLEHSNPLTPDPPTGVLVARVKVREDGSWLNARTDPIMNVADWEFWNGYFWCDDLQDAQPITPLRSSDETIKYVFLSDVQFSPHHNRFFMLQTECTYAYALGGQTIDWATQVSFLESDTPFGPFRNRQLLAAGVNADLGVMLTDASIFAIRPEKIITVAAGHNTLSHDPYEIAQTGYGSYFSYIPISG